MSRKSAREYAYKLIFEFLFERSEETPTLEIFLSDNSLSDADKIYLKRIYSAATENFDELCSLIGRYARGFTLERMFKPDLAAMLLCCAELKFLPDIPPSVSINECVDLVKNYSTEKSSGYVNGVLANIYRELSGNTENVSNGEKDER